MPTHERVNCTLDNIAPTRYVCNAGCNDLTPSSERGPPIVMPEDSIGGAGGIPAASRRGLRWGAGGPARLGAELRERFLRAVRADPDVMLYAARVSVWARWLGWLVGVFQLAYRPGLWYATDKEYLFLSVPLLAFNGFVHYRLRRDRAVTWRWLFFLSGMDIALITAIVIIGGDFHLFSYVTYYPALALFAVVFPSLWLSLAWATMAGAIYAVASLAVGPGLDFDAGQEKALFARVVAMYAIVATVSLIARFERIRRQESVERERELRRERIELSQAIHDTAAQTAYMIGLGIHKAVKLAGGANEELTSTLAATASLSKAAIWELRRPIDEGHLFEGRELGRVLWSHIETFERVASVPAEMLLSGTEPSLAVKTRAGLFSIAHNALTNAFLHAGAGRVEVRLDFGVDGIRLSVSDDGVGLPDDYAERGRGFRGMRADAERLGGRLIVDTGGLNGGTTVTCETPYR